MQDRRILRYRYLYTGSLSHEHTVLLRFLGIILSVLRLEVFIYDVYITNQFQTTFAKGGWGE
jgi:hypothetical protein